ncbi:hypothetical protein TNCV_1554941 [Trichonephila clavipes]|nr:hypothetical protein TNCV_1554941 [Trichonephila clavipes]
MNDAALKVRNFKKCSNTAVAECGVSVDGTWQRRGHSSLNGCVAALSIGIGKLLDLEIMSKFCRIRNTLKKSSWTYMFLQSSWICFKHGFSRWVQNFRAFLYQGKSEICPCSWRW